jgi:hypothetical protein
MDREVLYDIKATHGGKGKLFLDGWKEEDSIVIFLNCIRIVSRMKHRKPGNKAGFKTENNQKLWGLPFHAFSKPGCNQVTCNKDPYLSIYAKKKLPLAPYITYNVDVKNMLNYL